MAVTIDLSPQEARLLRLAVFEMLGHPRWRSEQTAGRQGLVDAYEQTSAVGDGGVALRVEPDTIDLLDSALRRLTSELKNYELLSSAAAGERSGSMVEGFDEELEKLFPGVASDRAEMDRLMPDLLALRRDFSQANKRLAEMAEERSAEAGSGSRRWQFWRR
jgi:hypothetical protein